jgi:hypothetical protein
VLPRVAADTHGQHSELHYTGARRRDIGHIGGGEKEERGKGRETKGLARLLVVRQLELRMIG